jgi:holo-[acyl-carrier protein] synthase
MLLKGHIIGIGIDLVSCHRLQNALQRTPDLMHRLFTSAEQDYARTQYAPYMVFAKRFAAKEAFAKASGCGIGALLSWTDIAIKKYATGQPYITLSDRAEKAVHQKIGGPFSALCSLTDEKAGDDTMAQAIVMIQRI